MFSTAAFRDMLWIHFCCVLTGAEKQIYLNGRLDKSIVYPHTLKSDVNGLSIGFAPNNAGMDGIIDEPRIWNRALSATEIASMYFNNIVPRDGLVGEWLFNEGSGTTALDTSGNGNNGTITGATYTLDVPLQERDVV